jgi:hypothetical protein
MCIKNNHFISCLFSKLLLFLAFNNKSIPMAKLNGPFDFEGKIGGISAFKMRGVNKTILRKPGGPTKEDIKTKTSCDITRRINHEFGGCSTAGKFVRRCFKPLMSVSDFNPGPGICSLMHKIQPLDTVSEYGKRSVLISKALYLLEGFNLNQRNPFDSIVRHLPQATIDKESLSASVLFPALVPKVNFFPPGSHSYFRMVAVLAVLPDLFFKTENYSPEGELSIYPQKAVSEWLIVKGGSEPTELELQLPAAPSFNSYSLVLSVGIEMGIAGPGGAIETIRHTGCGKILSTA